MSKKYLFTLVILFILSSCSFRERTTTFSAPEIMVEKVKEPSINDCSNVKELKKYFASLKYFEEIENPNLILQNIKAGMFESRDVKLRKEMFFKAIYPIVYQINEEIKAEREDLLAGRNINELMAKYKTVNLEELKMRVNVIPVEMFMAQAAIESAYGTSRFATEGNALFGQWTTAENGMIPLEKPNSQWKVARFDSLLESARCYALNINTHKPYAKLRKLRANGQNPIYGLANYSEKGAEYISLIRSIIKVNKLFEFSSKHIASKKES